MSSSIFQRRTGDLRLCWWWACICTLFGFDLFMYRKWLESFVYPPSHQHHFPFAFAAVGNQTSVSAWVIDSCFFWAKLCAFTRDAFNGLINRYKKMLDLVKRKKKKNHCQKSLHSGLLAVNSCISALRWKWTRAAMLKALAMSRTGRQSGLLLGWAAQREAGSGACFCIPLTQLPDVLPLGDFPAWGLVKRMWLKWASVPITTENTPCWWAGL